MSSAELVTQEQVLVGLVDRFLSLKRSENTRRAYRKDIADFFGGDPTLEKLQAFFDMQYPQAVGLVLTYKARLMECHVPATVNRRLAALRSLVDLAHTLGFCTWQLDSRAVSGEKVETYRDTSGISPDQVRALLAYPIARFGRGSATMPFYC